MRSLYAEYVFRGYLGAFAEGMSELGHRSAGLPCHRISATILASVERPDDLSHSLMPLELAVLIVRDKVYGSRSTGSGRNPDAIAGFIGATVPIYEYSHDPCLRPSAVIRDYENGLFRSGGRELHFLDGRPMLTNLAVKADDIVCVIAMLKDPEHAARIRGKAAKAAASRLRDRTDQLKEQCDTLREKFQTLSTQCDDVVSRSKQRRH